jgi:hypothetical protein
MGSRSTSPVGQVELMVALRSPRRYADEYCLDRTRRDDEPCGGGEGHIFILLVLVACVVAAKIGSWLA